MFRYALGLDPSRPCRDERPDRLLGTPTWQHLPIRSNQWRQGFEPRERRDWSLEIWTAFVPLLTNIANPSKLKLR